VTSGPPLAPAVQGAGRRPLHPVDGRPALGHTGPWGDPDGRHSAFLPV
jgi:hypothetical protein